MPDLTFFLVAVPAVMISGLGKGGMGNALGMLAVPLMSLVISPIKAAAIMLPLLLAMDGFAVFGWRQFVNWQMMRVILPTGLLGVVLGILTFDQMSESVMRLIIGTISILFCLNQWFGESLKKNNRTPGILSGHFWSTVAGFTSFGLHAGGAPLSIYLLPQKLEKQALAGTMAVFFGMINLSKLPAYGQLGQFTYENLIISAMLLPLCPISVRLGMKLVNRVSTDLFYKIIYASLFITGAKLLVDSLIS